MLPTDFSLFISLTTGVATSVYSYFHDNNISKCCLPQPAMHYIQYSLLACHIIMILASLPASCFCPLSGDWNLLRSLTSKVLLLWASCCNCRWSPLFWSVGMSKVRQRTQPLSCSRHKRNVCRAQAQAALLTMTSGLHGCLRAGVT